jgi:hypothetical protein
MLGCPLRVGRGQLAAATQAGRQVTCACVVAALELRWAVQAHKAFASCDLQVLTGWKQAV